MTLLPDNEPMTREELIKVLKSESKRSADLEARIYVALQYVAEGNLVEAVSALQDAISHPLIKK